MRRHIKTFESFSMDEEMHDEMDDLDPKDYGSSERTWTNPRTGRRELKPGMGHSYMDPDNQEDELEFPEEMEPGDGIVEPETGRARFKPYGSSERTWTNPRTGGRELKPGMGHSYRR